MSNHDDLQTGDHGAELRIEEVVVVMGHLRAIRTAPPIPDRRSP